MKTSRGLIKTVAIVTFFVIASAIVSTIEYLA
jgi:hypothetical protein